MSEDSAATAPQTKLILPQTTEVSFDKIPAIGQTRTTILRFTAHVLSRWNDKTPKSKFCHSTSISVILTFFNDRERLTMTIIVQTGSLFSIVFPLVIIATVILHKIPGSVRLMCYDMLYAIFMPDWINGHDKLYIRRNFLDFVFHVLIISKRTRLSWNGLPAGIRTRICGLGIRRSVLLNYRKIWYPRRDSNPRFQLRYR